MKANCTCKGPAMMPFTVNVTPHNDLNGGGSQDPCWAGKCPGRWNDGGHMGTVGG